MAKPTVAKAPSRIPQDVQQDIIALAVLRNQQRQIETAIAVAQERVTAKMTGAVRAVRA
jgi:hypothetical protein